MVFNVDISKVLPERESYAYLIAFIPGLFFEVSIYFANAPFIGRFAPQAHQPFAVSNSIVSIIAVLLAFIIGNGFMFIPTLIQYFLRYFYMLWWFGWKHFCQWPLKPLVDWLCKKPRFVRMIEVQNLNSYVFDIGFSTRPAEQERVWRCWLTFAQRLLKTRYGIESKDVSDHEWGVLYWMLGESDARDTRGSLLVFTLEATGWAGIAATRLAPAFSTKHFYYFCLFLIVNGLIHDWFVVRRLADPRASGYINVRAVLRELRKLPQQQIPPAKASDGTDE
jgi:hypothetical protein